jgi:glycosyltransferase involved in cell wall biosynthesis
MVVVEQAIRIGSRILDLIKTAPGLGGPGRRLHKSLSPPRARHDVSCPGYSDWVQRFDTPSPLDVDRHRDESAAFQLQPKISILMPVFDPEPALLDAAIRSVRDQAYTRWELCIAADPSSNPAVGNVLRRHGNADPRIKLHFCHARGHVSAASNTALEMATGNYVALLDHDDLLPPLALYWVVESINRHPDVQILYSDEDKVDAQGCRFDPYFKSDFNHVLLLAQNMISRLVVYRRDLVESVGGFRAGFEGAQDYDLVLRCVAAVSRDAIVHIPRILYHRRAIAGSTALSQAGKPAAVGAAQRAVTEHVRGFDSGATVEPAPESPMHLRVRHSLPSPAPLVSIVICTRDHESLLRTAIESISNKTTYPNYEIVVLDNGSRDVAALDYLASTSVRPGITVVRDDSPFNYSRLNNAAVRHTRGQLLCLLNDDIEVLTPGWLEEMASFAVQPHVGAVGARLWYPDGTLQHGGVIIGVGGVAGHAHPRLTRSQGGYFNRGVLQQELSAVTAACLMVRRDIFDEVGGLEEQIAVAFNDVDLCLRIRAAGYRIIWTPFAELIHHESASRGYEDNPEKLARFQQEVSFMQDRWGSVLDSDPYYNPNLSMRAGDFTLESSGPSIARSRAA